MAAPHIGMMGTYQYMSNSGKTHAQQDKVYVPTYDHKVVWINKKISPLDKRMDAPVPRYKLLNNDPRKMPTPEPFWVPRHLEDFTSQHSRPKDDRAPFRSLMNTRCEEWSTLRQILPSRGRPITRLPVSWGTGPTKPPIMTDQPQTRFPMVRSPMARFVEDMYHSNPLWQLY